MLPCVCSVIDHRGRQNVVRTSVTHSAAPRVPLFCSYHNLTSSVIYYWTDARQHGIYLLNRFHVAVCLFSNWSQMTSKRGKNKKVHRAWYLLPLSSSVCHTNLYPCKHPGPFIYSGWIPSHHQCHNPVVVFSDHTVWLVVSRYLGSFRYHGS